MAQRGRKSSAALSVVGPGTVLPRPAPPEDLTEAQKDIWWSIVNRMPADWFPTETHALLAQYCRHVVRASRVAQAIDKYEKGKGFTPKDYALLLRQEQIQTKLITTLSTKMRISQQSLYDKSKKKPNDERPLPCDDFDDEEEDED